MCWNIFTSCFFVYHVVDITKKEGWLSTTKIPIFLNLYFLPWIYSTNVENILGGIRTITHWSLPITPTQSICRMYWSNTWKDYKKSQSSIRDSLYFCKNTQFNQCGKLKLRDPSWNKEHSPTTTIRNNEGIIFTQPNNIFTRNNVLRKTTQKWTWQKYTYNMN